MKTRHALSPLAALLGGLLLLIACGPSASRVPSAVTQEPPATAPPEASIPLTGTEWTLTSLRGNQLVAGTSLTLNFYPDNYMEGSAGCNSYGVDYTARGQGLDLATIHRTEFLCEDPPGIMPQDDAFFDALAAIASYRATEDRLEFDNAEGETILIYARKLPPVVDPALTDTEWLLTSLTGSNLLAGSRITLNLGAEGFEGYAGCNNYGGEYEAADRGILHTTEIANTAMDCPLPEGIMDQEAAYLRALRAAAAYRLADGRLEIADDSGSTILVFSRKEEFATDPTALLGTVWQLVAIDGDSLNEGEIFTLGFYSNDILGGRARCRDYLATYQASGDDLNIMVEAMFDADCRLEDADLDQEAQFLGVLTPKADLRLGDGELEIYGEKGGVLLFEPLSEGATLDLEGPTWSLLAFVGPNPYVEEPEPWPVPTGLLEGAPIDLTFEGSTAQGSAGCNDYGATYSLVGSDLSFEAITSTKMGCLEPMGVMEQEARYLELLAAVTSHQVFGDRLWLGTGDGQALVFFAAGR